MYCTKTSCVVELATAACNAGYQKHVKTLSTKSSKSARFSLCKSFRWNQDCNPVSLVGDATYPFETFTLPSFASTKRKSRFHLNIVWLCLSNPLQETMRNQNQKNATLLHMSLHRLNAWGNTPEQTLARGSESSWSKTEARETFGHLNTINGDIKKSVTLILHDQWRAVFHWFSKSDKYIFTSKKLLPKCQLPRIP